MSLRRSARVQAKPISGHVVPDEVNDPKPAAKKRGRKSTGDSIKPDMINGDLSQAELDSQTMPPPSTPANKRRKTTKAAVTTPVPFTPTPSAIGLMTSTSNLLQNYSTGDIDDASPPPTRPAEPHHTNATLVTPSGTQIPPSYSNFEDSPSKKPTTTTKTILDDACKHLISVDEKLRPVIEKHYCRIFSPEGLAEQIDPFRSLTSGIMAQQVSGAAAKSIKNKFIALFPAEACPNGFPPPNLVAKTDITTLRTAGLSQRKAEYIQGLAQKFDSGELSAKMLMEGSDEEVMEKLVAVRGLGAWSVEMFMCFGLKRMDIFSTGDLGVQRGMAALVGRDVAKLKAKGGGKWKYMNEKDMLEISEKFRPYRSLFMWYMWRIEDVNVDAVQDNAERPVDA
ncbi:hypothetical protein AC578_8864 [Pseudocercospora eumusae]|uniref:HhH-GPD domain-containing protein n=1 Tax=Pseudocercospora eumusae TaxID=321146 RepID=A0A139HBJ8_9PEZI|nr:hypothetical protein AC578_8864 [Pseudocercospora eumusae]